MSQATLAAAIHVSRGWVGDFELGRLRVLDLRTVAILFALLGQKVSVKAFPTGEPLRDAGQSRLLGRFNERLAYAMDALLQTNRMTAPMGYTAAGSALLSGHSSGDTVQT